METRINVAELLRNCPRGMELDCTMWEEVVFDRIVEGVNYPIHLKKKDGIETLTENGCYHYGSGAKCVIFPKGKTTWEGFVPPVEFKDGDIVAAPIFTEGVWIGIFKQYEDTSFEVYCSLSSIGKFSYTSSRGHILEGTRLATEEEKKKLFQAINNNGYIWDVETKSLKLIKPKFEVGDRIKHIDSGEVATVVGVKETHYNLDSKVGISAFTIPLQREWELVTKFDLNTFKPYDKVLARFGNNIKWFPAEFGLYNEEDKLFVLAGGYAARQCIPFEGNEHLRGKRDDCDEFYKTWED